MRLIFFIDMHFRWCWIDHDFRIRTSSQGEIKPSSSASLFTRASGCDTIAVGASIFSQVQGAIRDENCKILRELQLGPSTLTQLNLNESWLLPAGRRLHPHATPILNETKELTSRRLQSRKPRNDSIHSKLLFTN